MAQVSRSPANSTTSLNRYLDLFKPLGGNSDILFAGAICLILAILFVPLPPVLLDLGLALSFAVSIIVLMVALWVKKPLDFNSFPTLLLIVTVMRLALSVASTRLILSQGHTGTDAAGNVIQGIANFVVGGDYIIGAIIFAILVAINFIVITKGTSRIAEVGARFNLDAMPGKQLAIDSDLGAGLIDEAEAKARRKEVEGESTFFGAMDGAAKFVRGDAVAGIIITAVNIIGGLAIGVMRQGMDFSSAAQTYTVLTIGDGLVTQIPALIVSIAAGVIATRGSVEGTAGNAIVKQLSINPRALYASAALMAGAGFLPGFPIGIFLPLAALIVTIALVSARNAEEDAMAAKAEAERKAEAPQDKEAEDPLEIDTIRLELGSGLIAMISSSDAALPGQVRSLRNLFAQEYGFILPGMRTMDSPILGKESYRILIQGVPVAQGEIKMGCRLLIDPDEVVTSIQGTRVKEPTFGLSALWIQSGNAAEAEAAGHTVVEGESVIITHLTEVIKEHMPELLSYGATLELIGKLDKNYSKLANDIPAPAPVILIQQVLQKLLGERVSIRNLPTIIEAMTEASVVTKNPEAITEHVRRKLAAQICATIEDQDGFLPVMTLGQKWEAEFAAAVKRQGDDITCMLTPRRVQDFIMAVRVENQKHGNADYPPALLVNPDFRAMVRSMLTRVCPLLPVISHGEIHRRARLRTVATIGD